jgi:hypothetical protein
VSRPAPRIEVRALEALAEVEAQRDDAIAYLSAARAILGVLARGYGLRACAQEVAQAIVAQLGVEACALVLRESTGGTQWVAGMATQAEQLGGPRSPALDPAWLTLAGLVGPGRDPVCFRRDAAGSFVATPIAALRDESYVVLPLTIADAPGGVLVLQLLAGPVQSFAQGPALLLVADLVGSALTVARTRDASGWLCDRLSAELGATQRALDEHAQHLRSREEHILALTRELARIHDGH